jgi:formylglycine-generating enzyme required for sulfatase activity
MPAKRRGIRIAVFAASTVLLVAIVVIFLNWPHLVAWYEFRQQFETLDSNAQGYAEYRHRQTGIVFVRVPAGTFLMGSPDDEHGRFVNEGPQIETTLSAFLIAKHEVTQKQWLTVMERGLSDLEGDDRPIRSVSWNDCQEFCSLARLSLPTEAQWEYACRAGSRTRFSSGRSDAGLATIGWFWANSHGGSHPVGQKKANAFGLHDMHGNECEWCEDRYFDEIDSTTDLSRTSASEQRVFRGGGWYFYSRHCRSARRRGSGPSHRGIAFGFRPCWQTPL